MSVDTGKIKQSLLAAIDEAERGMVRRRAVMESRQTAREDILAEVRQLHDAVLRLRCAAESDDLGRVEEDALEALSGLCTRLRDVVLADEIPSVTARVTGARETSPASQASKAVDIGESEAIDPEDHLRPIYQEILTLEENQGLFEVGELRDRVVLLLARMREAQDGEVGQAMDADQRLFMTTRFGLLESLQKRRSLGYMNELNRRHYTDWKAVIESLETQLVPLKDRIEELGSERVKDEARRSAAEEQAARRRLEGEEILDELRFFVRGPDLQTTVGRSQFRRLVAEAMSCLPTGYVSLHEIVDPHLELLEGKDFKGLRKSSRRLEPQDHEEPPELQHKPSTEADQEERLKGAFAGQRAVILGGRRRERAEQILMEHLGLAGLVWIGARALAVEGPEHAEALLAETGDRLLIILVDSLGENLVRRLRGDGEGGGEILVRGGQEVSRILSAIPGPHESRPSDRAQVASVGDALTRVMDEYPDALVTSFNKASRVKDYPYEDGESVYKAFQFLATTYRESRAGRKSCGDLSNELKRSCGFRYSPHQKATTMGRVAGDYVATYKGQRYELTEHLRRGVNRDPRYSIRIAFTYLPQEDRVLVGFLGQHQKTPDS